MTNYVPINNTILRDIVRCFNSHAVLVTLHAQESWSGIWRKTHTVFRVIIKVTEKLVIIR